MEHKRPENIRKSQSLFIQHQNRVDFVKTKSIKKSLEKYKKGKLKSGLYQDREDDGLRMTDINQMFNAKMSDSFTNGRFFTSRDIIGI